MDQNNQYFDMGSARLVVNAPQPKKKKNSGEFWSGLIVGIMGTLLVLCVCVLVVWSANNGNKSGNVKSNAGTQSTVVTGSGFVTQDMVDKIDKLVKTIRKKYFLAEVSDEALETGIYKGLFEALGDPYSEYYTPEEYEELIQSSEGIYYGIGAVVSIDSQTNLPKLGTVFKKSPAEQAGLRTNDLVYKVDGEETYGKSLSEVVSHIRGEENTKVDLVLIRDGEQIEKTVVRGRVETPTVETQSYENGIGYLRITEFDDVTTKQFLDGMEELYQQGMKGLILDLRSNPGGNLSTVVEIGQNLLPEGLIVYAEDKEGRRSDFYSDGTKEIQIPMVVLVDMNSASASEILAGAIQDYKKGVLIGTTTFGKGIVQSIMSNGDGSAVKVTVSGYFTPNGRNIHKIGIEPDIVCEFDSEAYYNEENPVDNQLEKAKEVLADMMK